MLLAGAIALTAFSYPASSQMSDIAPDGITYVGDSDTFTSGETYNITAQLLFAGGPLHSEGVRVYFTATDASIIPAELGTYSLTDNNGIANFTFTANKTGDSNLTVSAMSANSGKTANKRFHVIQTSSATPAPSATPSPSPSLSVTPVPSTNATATPEPTVVPTVVPTTAPTVGPTATTVPTSTPSTGDPAAQARGIIAVGIVLAIALLIIVLVARLLGKK